MQVKLRSLTASENDQTYQAVAGLFTDMYAYLDTKGLVHRLAEVGGQLWINTIKRSLEKLNMVVIATHEEDIIGFAAGNIRVLPNYLGSKKVGYISSVYVSDAYKKQNIGQKLVTELEQCFAEKTVEAIELEVLIENDSARHFWEKMGYTSDNLRMIKTND